MGIMALEKIEQQTTESILLSMDFDNILGSSETISSVTSVTSEIIGSTTASDLTIGTASISSDGKSVNFRCSGGTENKLYLIEVLVVTSAGNTYEGDGQIRLVD